LSASRPPGVVNSTAIGAADLLDVYVAVLAEVGKVSPRTLVIEHALLTDEKQRERPDTHGASTSGFLTTQPPVMRLSVQPRSAVRGGRHERVHQPKYAAAHKQ
jgi:hypothetical protein